METIKKTPLPKIGAPATRALNNAGITYIEQLTKMTEKEVLALHGMGPKALRILKENKARFKP